MGRKKNKRTPPTVLITTDEYLEAPRGTIVAELGQPPFHKSAMQDDCPDEWICGRWYAKSSGLSGTDREVLRWGYGKNGD